MFTKKSTQQNFNLKNFVTIILLFLAHDLLILGLIGEYNDKLFDSYLWVLTFPAIMLFIIAIFINLGKQDDRFRNFRMTKFNLDTIRTNFNNLNKMIWGK